MRGGDKGRGKGRRAEFWLPTDKPFNLTPSPRYLYLGEVHKEALASLSYGVVERKGLIVLTGEVGSGKTTMVQALLANLDENVETVYVCRVEGATGLAPQPPQNVACGFPALRSSVFVSQHS